MKKNKEWLYRMDLLKDGTAFKTLMVVYAISGGVVGSFMFVTTLGNGFFEALKVGGIVLLILVGIFLVLSTVAYYGIYVPMSGRCCNRKLQKD